MLGWGDFFCTSGTGCAAAVAAASKRRGGAVHFDGRIFLVILVFTYAAVATLTGYVKMTSVLDDNPVQYLFSDGDRLFDAAEGAGIDGL